MYEKQKSEHKTRDAKVQKYTPGLCNTRPGAQSVCTFDTKLGVDSSLKYISFDRITLTFDLSDKHAEQFFANVSSNPIFKVKEQMQTKLVATILEHAYFCYDSVQAKAYNKRNARLDFNPNKLDWRDIFALRTEVLDYASDINITRLDVACDFVKDLSNYMIMSKYASKKARYYDKNDKLETYYFGSAGSKRYIRMYDKRKERKANADIDLGTQEYWRFEFELRSSAIDNWYNCADDLTVISPRVEKIENFESRATLYYLMNHGSEWHNVHRNTRRKYKQLLSEVSEDDIAEDIRKALKQKFESLNKQLDYLTYEKNPLSHR